MKNLIFINDAFYGGGAEKSMRILINGLIKKQGFKFELIVLDTSNNVEKDRIINWCDKRHINIISLGNKKNIFLKILQLLYLPVITSLKLKKKKNISIIAFQNRSNYIAILLKIFSSIDLVIISERNFSSKFFEKGLKGLIHKLLISKLYPLSNKIITNSSETRDDLIKSFGIKSNKVSVICNGYDFNKIRIDSEKRNNKLNIILDKKSNEKIFITVARLEEQKGYFRLIEAVSIYKKLFNKDFIWLIIGEGKQKKLLIEYTKKKGIGDNVYFLGYVDNPLPFVKSSDLFLFGSYYEGFPNALAEAVILNIPIVTFYFKSGLYEVINDYPNSSIIKRNSRNNFAREISQRLVMKKYSFEPYYNKKNLIDDYYKLFLNV